MKLRNVLLLTATFAITQATAFAHDTETRLTIERANEAAVQAGKVTLDFDLFDTKKKVIVKESDLQILHEKKLHFFSYDPALVEYKHEHPTFSDSKWHVTVNLPKNGNYWIWVQGQLIGEADEVLGANRLKVIGGATENPAPAHLENIRAGTDGTSKVTLSADKFIAGQMAMPMLTFSRTDGSQPQITPYLGAKAHILIVSEDGDGIIHTHPMDHGMPNMLMLHTQFADEGAYRLWVQFMDNNLLKTVPLSVLVSKM